MPDAGSFPNTARYLAPATAAERLSRIHAGSTAEDRLADTLLSAFPGGTALVSSFGADSAVLLHMVSRIAPETPVLFLETEMLFPETLDYQRELARLLGLGNVQLIRPDREEVAAEDPQGRLNGADPDACCALRKARPLARALAPFEAWITGRKRAQAASRAGMALFEPEAGTGRIKVNPLADWTAERLRAYRRDHALPPHPLEARGYPSIGCAPCTSPVAPGEDPRAGRWRGRAKTECGIHFDGRRWVRAAGPAGPAG
jgi:phosphoadenosine phosphosulfate reductase